MYFDKTKYFNKTICFSKRGNKSHYTYDIVVRNKKGSKKLVEKIGFFDPKFSQKIFALDSGKLCDSLSNGARMSLDVKKLYVKFLKVYR